MARIANKLLRQITRHLGHADAAEKMSALASLVREKPEIFREYEPIVDGFAAFLASVEEAYAQYEDKTKMAIRNLQLSSDELNKVNRKLEFLNISMNAMLESLGPGLLFFDKNGLCSEVFSKSCRDYLESDPGGRYIWDVLGLVPAEAENFKALMKYIGDNNSAMSFDDLMSLAPHHKTRHDGKKLKIEYRPMSGFGADAQGVLVIITDQTQEEKTRKLIEEKEKAATYILRLAKNRSGFQLFVNDLKKYFLGGRDAGHMTEKNATDILRAVHTFKGLAGVFFAENLAFFLHEIEEVLPSKSLEEAQAVISRHAPKIEALCRDVTANAEMFFGENFIAQGETKAINVDKMRDFHALLSKGGSGAEAAKIFMREFLTVPIREKLEPLDYYMQELGQRLGKKVLPSRFEGENFLILDGPYKSFLNSLVHIARNIVDHGLEEEEVRQMLGKPRGGQVVFRTEKFQKKAPSVRIVMEDDGAGIDKEKIRRRLVKNGVVAGDMKDKELLAWIFQPGFSARDSATALSGRGVGLSAVYEEVKRLGGEISVVSEPRVGTRFIIELPFLD